MELDDFRRQWQQQAALTGSSSQEQETELKTMVTLRSSSPVSRMRHNAQVEIIATAISLGIAGATLLLGNAERLLPFWLLLLATGLLAGYDYYHKVRLLRDLGECAGPLQSHVRQQLQRLRKCLQLNYRFVMATLILTLGFLLCMAYVHVPQLFQGDERALWQRGLWLVLTALASWAITHWLVRWQLQDQYGRHLDRLESALRELDETQ